MRNLTDDQARQVLEHSGVKSPDLGGAMWRRALNAVQAAYRLGLDAETIKVVHKEAPK